MRERKHRLRRPINKNDKNIDRLLLWLILLAAGVLRFWNFTEITFMHDEFSALFRTDFDSFRDLIVGGVLTDTHPAGVQILLYYWVKIVGWNPFWIKLPFAIAGTASVFLVYKIGQQWYNEKTGLMAAAFFAVSQFAIFHSQTARPYAMGLLFILLMAFFWNKMLFSQKEPDKTSCIGFTIATWLAATMHTFSIAQAGLIYVTGLFLLNRRNIKAYLLCGVVALLLFSPNLYILYQQLIVNGSIGAWLSMPEKDFILDFLQYTMNYSSLFIFGTIIIIILPFIFGKIEKSKLVFRIASVVWFAINYATAYIYSIVKEPILQYSTLLFCFPFVMISAFSLYRRNTIDKIRTILIVAAILFMGITSLIINRDHYHMMYEQGYDQIAASISSDYQKYDGDICFATYSEAAKISEYCQRDLSTTNRIVVDKDDAMSEYKLWLKDSSNSYMGMGWTDYANPKWEAAAFAYYPYMIQRLSWFNSNYYTLAREPQEGATKILTTLPYKDKQQYNIDITNREWSPVFTISGDSLKAETEVLGFVAKIDNADTLRNCMMVVEIRDAINDSTYLWTSSDKNELLLPGCNIITNGIRYNHKKLSLKGKTIRVYIWNRDKAAIMLNEMLYFHDVYDPKLGGLYEPMRQNFIKMRQ